jgi:hypothetical protein
MTAYGSGGESRTGSSGMPLTSSNFGRATANTLDSFKRILRKLVHRPDRTERSDHDEAIHDKVPRRSSLERKTCCSNSSVSEIPFATTGTFS